MSKFTPTVKFEVEFEGDTVKFELRRMTNKHMVQLAPFLKPDEGSDTFRNSVLRSATLIDACKPVLEECVVSMIGLTDSAGKALTIKEVVPESYFMRLIDQLLGKLIAVSLLSEQDAKKLEQPQPAAGSVESPSGTASATS